MTISRRACLGTIGGTAALGAIAAGTYRMFQKPVRLKRIIDAHIHVAAPKLPGVPDLLGPDGRPFGSDASRVAAQLTRAMRAAGVEHALCMPSWEITEDDPLGIASTLKVAALVPGLHPVGFADPTRTDADHLRRVEKALKARRVKALKAYLGYLHHAADSPGYRPYYEIAGAHNVPVILHTGDNYSRLAKVKYAHPLPIDEVAVDHPGTNFVIAHVGYPWLIDAAEVIYKNNQKGGPENVWADLSGLAVGTPAEFEDLRRNGALDLVKAEVRKALYYTQKPRRLMYGSDWPLAPMSAYRDFIGELVPEEFHQLVFHENAASLYELGGTATDRA